MRKLYSYSHAILRQRLQNINYQNQMKNLGSPKTTSKTRESPNDYVRRILEKYKYIKNISISTLMEWDRQEKEYERKNVFNKK